MPVTPFANASDFVPSQLNEAIKTYSVYDGSGRLIEHYSAAADAVNGQACLVTYYEYDGASNRVLKSKEDKTTWDETWDI